MTSRDFGDSRWAVLAGLVLLLLALPIVGLGIVLVAQGVTYDDPGGVAMGYGTLAMIIGAVVTAIGIIHAVSAIYIWRHQAWARSVGIVFAALGATLATVVLPGAFNPVYTRGIGGEVNQAGPNLTTILIGLSLIPYLIVVIGLVLGGRHFSRLTETSTS